MLNALGLPWPDDVDIEFAGLWSYPLLCGLGRRYGIISELDV